MAGPSTEGDGEKEGEGDGEEKGEVVEAVLTEEDLIQQSQAEYDSGRYSPTLLLPAELPLDTHTITPDEDTHKLHLSRRQLAVTGKRLYTPIFIHAQKRSDILTRPISTHHPINQSFSFCSPLVLQVMPMRMQRMSLCVAPNRAWAGTRLSLA